MQHRKGNDMTQEEYQQWLKENPPNKFKVTFEGDDKVYKFEELKLPDEGVGTYERVPILGGIDYDENGKIVYRKE